MSTRLKIALCATVAVISQIDPRTGVAQTAQTSAAASTGLEEIVVTARRREERLQTVPLAITAFSGDDIEKKHINDLSDLGLSVPSLAVTQEQSDPNAIYSNQLRLRGLAGTVVYFADVPVGNTDFSTGSASPFPHGTSPGYYYDLDNVEVLKGPQGTLFGKNSIGGLISITPKKPTNDFEGYVKASFGNYNDREFEAAVNIPIVADKLLVRVAGQSQQRDGYTTDVSTGKDLDNRNYYAWRVGVTFRPTDDLENYFLYDGYWQDSNGTSSKALYVNSNFPLGNVPLPGIGNVPLTLGNGVALSRLLNPATQIATYTSLLETYLSGGKPSLSFYPNIGQLLAEQQRLGARATLGNPGPTIGKDYDSGYTNTTTWDLNDDLRIKNIAAARIFKSLATSNPIGLPLPIVFIGDLNNNVEWGENTIQYSEEFQLQGKSINDKLAWVVGGYLEFDHPLGDSLLPTTDVGTTSFTHDHVSTRSQAAFAHGIYDLSDYVDGLRFSAGYRYTWDFSSVQTRATSNVDRVTRDATGAANNCSSFGADNNCYTSADAHFSAYGWNLSLDEQLDPGTLIYVRAGNAYRPGTSNPVVPLPFQDLKPEHVTDVEVGAKVDWELMGAHIRTNGDLYHTDYKSIQVNQLVTVVSNNGTPTAQTLETNAASAYLEGGELEAVVVPFEGLAIAPHLAYIYTHYNTYPSVAGGGPGYAPPFNYTPKWQYGASVSYHLPIDVSYGDVELTSEYSWKGHEYESGPPGEIFPIAPSYANLNVGINWTNAFQRPVDISFFMTNALDATHVVGINPIYTVLGVTSVEYNEPRMFGFSVKYRFDAGEESPPTAAVYTPPPVVAPAATPKSYLVFFDFNKSDLTPQATQIVAQAAHNAGLSKAIQLTVTGHTDTVGSDAYNMRLSRRRAESVASQLEKDGIPSSEISIVGKGKRDLLVPTADGVREPQNRRVQIVYDGAAAS